MYRLHLFFSVLAIFGCACDMAPAAAGGGNSLPEVSGGYDLNQEVLFKEQGPGDPVGYAVKSRLNVRPVHPQLLLIQFESPQLHIMSRKAPKPHGFIGHTSNLDSMLNKPFLVEFAGDKKIIDGIHVDPEEHVAMINLKRGIASLFQFQNEDLEREETDASGLCSVVYSNEANIITKIKSDCRNPTTESHQMLTGTLWGGKLKSESKTLFALNKNDGRLESVTVEESHTFEASISYSTVSKVTTKTELKLTDLSEGNGNYYGDDVEAVVSHFGNEFGVSYKKYDLIAQKEPAVCKDEACPLFAQLVAENRKALAAKELGSTRSALSLVKLVRGVRQSTPEEIFKILNAKENKNILPQLMDVLGSAQNENAHQAALKKLKLNKDYDLDLCERYLWALSISPKPREAIIEDLLKIVQSGHKDEKLYQTLVLTLAATAHKYGELHKDSKLVNEVGSLLREKLVKCSAKDENCRQVHLRGFANLAAGGPQLATLLDHAVNSTGKSNVAAVYAISRMNVGERQSTEVLRACERIYLASSRSYDSSARTIALDILLEAQPSDIALARLLSPLKHKDTPKEIKQYLLQRLAQISDKDLHFRNRVRRVMSEEKLYHYNGLAQGGLSTAFDRDFMSSGGTLSTSQEIFNGILKRGRVHVNLLHNDSTDTVFTLGLFSNGLGSFVSQDSGSDEEEASSAGMQVTVMGVELRPFVFFSGNGELMSHVWSGTASTKTPAYQALVLIGDESSSVNLGCGFVAGVELLASASVDLSGQIQISIWNRNAETLVQNSAGLAVSGIFKVDSHIVKSRVEFNLLTEPRLDLSSEINFYDGVELCLMLKQPDTSLRLNTYKIERIPGSKHRLRKTRYRTIRAPGKSYALNHKNNEMCEAIHQVDR